MQHTALTACLFLLISFTTHAQSAPHGKKTTKVAPKYYPPAGLYMAPSTATDSTVKTLFLMIDGKAYLANDPWPLVGDTTVQTGTYRYDAQKHAVLIKWEHGSTSEWMPIQKDSSLTLKGLNFKLGENADSVEARNQRNRKELGIEE